MTRPCQACKVQPSRQQGPCDLVRGGWGKDRNPINDSLYKDCAINEIDFTASLILGGAQLSPKAGRHQPHSPVVIAYTSNKLVEDHNGIFGKTFSDFLTDYVACVEGKHVLSYDDAVTSNLSRLQ